MRLLSVVSVAAVASIALIQSASAADMPAGAPVYKAPGLIAPTWTGFYVGGNVGYGRDSNTANVSGVASDPAVAPFLAFFLASGGITQSLDPSAHGFVGGGQIGYNWQVKPDWLVGVEADIQGSGIKGTDTGIATPQFLDVSTTSVGKKLDWFGTVRVRAGVLVDPSLLLYGTGGFAYGKTEISFSTADVTSGCIVGATICADNSGTRIHGGWTVGGGIEAMVARHWTVRAEYLYVDLGEQTLEAPSSTAPITFSATGKFQENIVRIGANYLFN
jgi:outer membrane immunogenic protein